MTENKTLSSKRKCHCDGSGGGYYPEEDVKETIQRIKADEIFKETSGELAEWLHDTYEEISKKVNWKTQKKCQVKFKDLPKENQSVMLKIAQAIQLKYPTRILLKIDKEVGSLG